jgi:hypothetical protein
MWVLRTISDPEDVSALYNMCLTQPHSDPSICKQDRENLQAALGAEARWAIVWFVLAPIPIFWLIAFALVALLRWIRRGFSPS